MKTRDSTKELVLARALRTIHNPWNPRVITFLSNPAVIIEVSPTYKQIYYLKRGTWWFAGVEGYDSHAALSPISLHIRAKNGDPRVLSTVIAKALYDFYVNVLNSDSTLPPSAILAARAAIPDIQANALAVGLGIL